jgi:hypothetical protein
VHGLDTGRDEKMTLLQRRRAMFVAMRDFRKLNVWHKGAFSFRLSALSAYGLDTGRNEKMTLLAPHRAMLSPCATFAS